jgi:hypothetical protein
MTNSPVLQCDLRLLSEEEIKCVLEVVADTCESLDRAGHQLQIEVSCLDEYEN